MLPIFRKISTFLMSKLSEIYIGPIAIRYDYQKHLLQIRMSNKVPLRVQINNGIELQMDGQFVLETSDEINIISHESLITMDSLDSRIYLNSGKAKKLRDSGMIIDVKDYTQHHKDPTEKQYDQLKSFIENINNRLIRIESNDISKFKS